jgi:uncharacterized RDD family membrane protein YckC
MQSETPSTVSELPESICDNGEMRTICGFWRRILALIIDAAILGILGIILGIFLFDFFVGLGGWGRLVGFIVALLYSGLLNSSLGRGQTIGKRLTKIKVVDGTGSYISLSRSFIRSTILSAPFFLNGALIPTSMVLSPVGFFFGFIVFGVGGAIDYLYIFNRRTRQSLHDLIVGTYVIKSSATGKVAVLHIWKGHLVIVGIWFLAIIIFITIVAPKLTQIGPFPELLSVQRSIQNSGKVHTATASVGKIWSGGKETKYFKINAIWKSRPENYDDAAEEIASIVLKEYPHITDQNILSVTITYGYDIGIARAWKKYTTRYDPNDCGEKLGKIHGIGVGPH